MFKRHSLALAAALVALAASQSFAQFNVTNFGGGSFAPLEASDGTVLTLLPGSAELRAEATGGFKNAFQFFVPRGFPGSMAEAFTLNTHFQFARTNEVVPGGNPSGFINTFFVVNTDAWATPGGNYRVDGAPQYLNPNTADATQFNFSYDAVPSFKQAFIDYQAGLGTYMVIHIVQQSGDGNATSIRYGDMRIYTPGAGAPEWSATGGGNWADGTKWNNGSPPPQFTSASTVRFGSSITGPATVTLNRGEEQVARLIFDSLFPYTLAGSSPNIVRGNANFPIRAGADVLQGNHRIENYNSYTNTGFTIAPGSVLEFGNYSTNPFTLTIGPDVFPAFYPQMDGDNGNDGVKGGGTLAITGSFRGGRVAINAPGGVRDSFLDLRRSFGAMDYIFNSTPDIDFRQELASWYNGGARDGKGYGTTASGDPRDPFSGVGFLFNSFNGLQQFSSFLGLPTGPRDVVWRYTYLGDTNLDGLLDAADYNAVLNGYTNALTGWQNGDVNYDGVVNDVDWGLFLNAYNYYTSGGLPWGNEGTVGAIPEPAALGLLAAIAPFALRRRR
jgi:MYXO-CTERM domain-containing protein